MHADQGRRNVAPQLTAEEAKCIRIALIFGDPAYGPRPEPDPRLESAKAKLRAMELPVGASTEDTARASSRGRSEASK